ncbi:MAG TPA: gamma-glutamylcyclotransferase, partial [Pseudohaliea sp.]|nr:gamma-glutamylcyclotransferase [Pseudohaliea sp.]
HRVPITLDGEATPVHGFLYVAPEDNPAFLGPAPLEDLARHIADAAGPSGSNGDYLLQLARALHALESYDEHVHPLAERVDALLAARAGK